MSVPIEFDAGKLSPSPLPPILAGTHQLPRCRSSGLRFTSKSFIASYRVCPHRVWRRETVAFAVTADSARHPIKFSDIDPAASYAAANHPLHRIRYFSVDIGAGKLPPSPFPSLLASTSSSSQISIWWPRIHLRIIRCIVLGVSPSRLEQGNRRLCCHCLFWLALHQVLGCRSSGLRYTCESLVASYYVCLH
jgi:hypothetical protein